MAIKVVLSPKLPAPLVEIARSLLPADFDLQVVDQGTPEFDAAIKDAEYLTGFTRSNMGPDFYRGAPKLKLIQLISAGYDRLDIEAARQARVPVANNGGSNSVAVAEHTLMLILAVYKKLAWHHNNVVAGKWRVGGFSPTRVFELAREKVRLVGPGTVREESAPRGAGLGPHRPC